jgi:hypothetical protein
MIAKTAITEVHFGHCDLTQVTLGSESAAPTGHPRIGYRKGSVLVSAYRAVLT